MKKQLLVEFHGYNGTFAASATGLKGTDSDGYYAETPWLEGEGQAAVAIRKLVAPEFELVFQHQLDNGEAGT